MIRPPRLSPRPGQHEVDLPPVAMRTDEPLGPVANRRFGAIALGLLGSIRFDLVPTIPAPHDDPGAGRRSAAERRGWAGMRCHWTDGALYSSLMSERV
jgi:hypothetical protein